MARFASFVADQMHTSEKNQAENMYHKSVWTDSSLKA